MKKFVLFILLLTSLTSNAKTVKVGDLWFDLYEKNNTAFVTSPDDGGSYSGDIVIPEYVIVENVEYKVTVIGAFSFRNCTKLTSVVIPNNVTSIGSAAFENCRELASVEMPSSVTEIWGSAFRDCWKLTEITIPIGVTYIHSGTFENCNGLLSVTIPDGVTNIDGYAFSSCNKLTSLTIPNSVTYVGDGAFSCSDAIETIVLGSGVKEIGNNPFNGCTGLKDVYCYAEECPTTFFSLQMGFLSQSRCPILHVPNTSIEAYKADTYWNDKWAFRDIVALTDEEASVEPMLNDDNIISECYQINGQRIGQPTKGLNIIKKGSKSTKVLIK